MHEPESEMSLNVQGKDPCFASPDCDTGFAPAKRAPDDDILRQHERFLADGHMELLDAVGQMILVLSRERQVVAANKAFLLQTGETRIEEILGKRPGEILHCVNATRQPGGCGSTEFCSQCGAVKSILSSLEGNYSENVCRMLTHEQGRLAALVLSVTGAPFRHAGRTLSIFTVADISAHHRRLALERTFFHDLLNTAGGLEAIVGMMADEPTTDLRETMLMVRDQFGCLLDEIRAQKDLMAAERGELQTSFSMVRSLEEMMKLLARYQRHGVAEGRIVEIDPECEDLLLETDPVLLGRVLGNMVKNALEASRAGQRVRLFCRSREDGVEFAVHNESHMERSQQLQLFTRSFSTKGEGRGIGTFSMKLLGEEYLKGRVAFDSSPEKGTTFTLTLPATQHP